MAVREYGDRFEAPIIVIMSAVILLSLVGVYMMVRVNTPDCTASKYTYCGSESHAEEGHHAESPHN